MPKKIIMTMTFNDEQYRELVSDMGFAAGEIPDCEVGRLFQEEMAIDLEGCATDECVKVEVEVTDVK